MTENGNSGYNPAFMKRAIELAVKNAGSVTGGPFGAVIVKDGRIIAESANSVTVDNDPTAHAEVNAIRKACSFIGNFSLEGCHLYTSCEPCPMCLSAAYWARIERIFYAADQNDAAEAGFDDSYIYRELALPVFERNLPVERVMQEEGKKPFDMWIVNQNKIEY